VRRWRNLPFRRGTFQAVPAPVAAGLSQPPRRRAIRAASPPRGHFFPVPRAAVAVAHVTPVAPQPRRAPQALRAARGRFLPLPPPVITVQPPVLVPALLRQPRRFVALSRRAQAVPVPQPGTAASSPPRRRSQRLARPPRGQFLAVPPLPLAIAAPPWVAPPLRQSRRGLLPRRRGPVPAVTAITAAVPAGMPRRVLRAATTARGHFLAVPPAPLVVAAPSFAAPPQARRSQRLARVPRGQFLPVPPAPVVAAATGPLVAPLLRQRRTQPLRIPRGHRSDPPWQGTAALPPVAIPAQFIRQAPARARLPRRGCILAAPFPPPAGVPAQLRRRARQGTAQPRRGCIFRTPAPPLGNTSPGPWVSPFLRPAGSRPRWPARPRRGCWYSPPWYPPPPPVFTIGALTAGDAPSGTLTAAGATAQLTAAVSSAALTAADARTGGPQ
jgi:hypothetical protein